MCDVITLNQPGLTLQTLVPVRNYSMNRLYESYKSDVNVFSNKILLSLGFTQLHLCLAFITTQQ